MIWVEVTTASYMLTMPTDVKSQYDVWLAANPDKTDRLATHVANTLREFRDAIKSHPDNVIDERETYLPQSCIRHLEAIVTFQLAMEIGIQLSSAGNSARTSADVFLRSIPYGRFKITTEEDTSLPTPRFSIPSRSDFSSRALPAILAALIAASASFASWIKPGSTTFDWLVIPTHSPANYTNTTTTLYGHLQGIDAAFASAFAYSSSIHLSLSNLIDSAVSAEASARIAGDALLGSNIAAVAASIPDVSSFAATDQVAAVVALIPDVSNFMPASESSNKFVNIGGDTMSGPLVIGDMNFSGTTVGEMYYSPTGKTNVALWATYGGIDLWNPFYRPAIRAGRTSQTGGLYPQTNYIWQVYTNAEPTGYYSMVEEFRRTYQGATVSVARIKFNENTFVIEADANPIQIKSEAIVRIDNFATWSASRWYDPNTNATVTITATGGVQVGKNSFYMFPTGDIQQDDTNSAILGHVSMQSMTIGSDTFTNFSFLPTNPISPSQLADILTNYIPISAFSPSSYLLYAEWVASLTNMPRHVEGVVTQGQVGTVRDVWFSGTNIWYGRGGTNWLKVTGVLNEF